MANEELKARNVDRALQAAAELILANGISGTTKEMIAKASGLSRKSLDRYFIDKVDCTLQTAKLIGKHVWDDVNAPYYHALLTGGDFDGAQLLERYLFELKNLFVKDPRLFVFYTECEVYFSRHSADYVHDCTVLFETTGCLDVLEQIYRLGLRDGSLPTSAHPQSEAKAICRTYISFLSGIAPSYESEPEYTLAQIDLYISRVMSLYRSETTSPVSLGNRGA